MKVGLMEQNTETAKTEYKPKLSREEETRELLDLFEYADEYRREFEEDEESNWKRYEGFREQIEGRSSLHIPRTYEQIDTLRAQFVQALTQNRPYIEFVPQYKRPEELEQTAELEKKSELAAALVDNQLEKNNWEAKVYQYVTNCLVSQVAVMGVGWRQEIEMVKKRAPVQKNVIDILGGLISGNPEAMKPEFEIVEEEEVIWDDNELTNIDFFDFWPDPRANECHPDACRFVFVREWMTWDDLQEYLQMLDEQGAGTVYEVDREDVDNSASSDFDSSEYKKRRTVGRSFDDRDGSEYTNDKHLQLYEILHYWEDDRHAVLVERYTMVYSGPSPYWKHRKKPVVTACYEPIQGQFYGRPAAKILEHLQEELDTLRNQRIDNVSMIINRMWIRVDSSIPDASLVSKPHNIIDSTRPDGVVPLQTPDVTSSAYQEEAVIKADMETALPTPPITRGVGQEQKATNAMINNTNATTRYSLKLRLFEAMGIKRLGYLMDLNNQQFIEEPRLVKFVDQEGAAAWRMANIDDTFGEHEYRPASAGIDPTLNKEIKRQQLIQLYPIAAQDQFVDQYKFRKLLYKSFDKDFLEILRPEEEIMAEMQMQKIASGMMAMQQQELAAKRNQQADNLHEMDMFGKGIEQSSKLIDLIHNGNRDLDEEENEDEKPGGNSTKKGGSAKTRKR
jgi:hypothetical protein